MVSLAPSTASLLFCGFSFLLDSYRYSASLCLCAMPPSPPSLLQLFFWSKTLEFVISVGGAVLFCGFILFDTHLIMHRLSPEEYVLASVSLYLDFINLFLYILRILQAVRRD